MISPRLRAKNGIPYGGQFDLNLPEKGIVGRNATNFTMLLDKVRDWRKANGWPIGLGLEDEVELEACRKYSAECDETSESVPKHEGITFQDVIAGTKAALANWWTGRKLVGQEEADRRALICKNCPNNVHVAMPCAGICAELRELVGKVFGADQQTTPHDGALKNCAVCACWLQTAVWIDVGVQSVGLSEVQKEQFRTAARLHGCWKG